MSYATTDNTEIDRNQVQNYLRRIRQVAWPSEGKVSTLVETPEPHRHATRERVEVVAGKGFAGDHDRKSYYRGAYVPGREVSAVALEVLDVLGVDPLVVGDNLITEGIDLASLREGDLLRSGEVVLERSHREHRPCVPFRQRTSPEAFAVAARGLRGALFVVRTPGSLKKGDVLHVVRSGRAERVSSAR